MYFYTGVDDQDYFDYWELVCDNAAQLKSPKIDGTAQQCLTFWFVKKKLKILS
jgi:hypothetical protein